MLMSGDRVVNSQSFHDGKIVLYQLENRPRKKWLCRFKVPNGTGYLYRGAGTSDFYEARKWADAFYEDLLIKVKLGQAVTGRDFKKLLAQFETNYPSEAPSPRRAADVLFFLKGYALPYFAKNRFVDFSETEVTKFFDWRRANPKRKAPSNATILAEMSHFKTFADWCYRRGHIGTRVEFDRPSLADNRRPHFNDKDWAKLTRFLREWVKDGKTKSGSIYRDRLMLTNYVLVLANTGIRVGEARNLKWSDIDTFEGDDKKQNIVLQVHGKTGAREVVARTPVVKDYLHKIWLLRCDELRKPPSVNDLIFCHEDGTSIQSFKKGFAALVREGGVEKDSEGKRRVIYSLRHTYATFRLQEGVNHYVLARNMGTSVKMLESFYGHTSNRAMASELTKSRGKERKRLPWD